MECEHSTFVAVAFLSTLLAFCASADNAYMIRRWTTVDGLPENKVTSLGQSSDGYLWVTTPLGISRFDGVRFATYLSPNVPAIEVRTNSFDMSGRDAKRFGLSGYRVLCSYKESNGVVWIGTDGDGLIRLRQRLVSIHKDQEFLIAANGVSSLDGAGRFMDSGGCIWAASESGCVTKMHPNGSLRRFGASEGLTARHVTSFAETPDGSIWIGSDGTGLWRMSHDRATHHRYSKDVGSEFIKSLFCDSEGALWIGTRSDGVVRLKDGIAKTVSFVRLGNATPRHFREEPKGRIWIETDKILFSFLANDFIGASPESGAGCRTEVFRASDGYVHREGTHTKVSQSAYDSLCALPRPHVIIETPLPGREFPPDTEEVQIRYTADAPGFADRTTYSVRLLPKREEWRYIQSAHRQTYSNLPPGRYRFEVRARLTFGDWGEVSALEFTIASHFYETRTFSAIVLGLLLALTVFIVRTVYVRRLRARMAIARQRNILAAERARIARDIHDDVGARLTRILFLTGISSDGGMAMQEVSDEVRDVVRALDEVVWAIEPRNDTLSAFADYLYNYAEMYLESFGLRMRANIPVELPDAAIGSVVRHAAYMCVKEALNNLVKHAKAGTAFFSMSVCGDEARITIGDDGVGFEGPREGGNGLENMRSRMESIGGTFRIGAREGGGCEVALAFRIDGKGR